MPILSKGDLMRMKILTVSILTLLTLFGTGCGEKREEPAESTQKTEISQPKNFILGDGNQSIEATLNDEGFDFNISEPIVMLDFFATWCPPCRAEIPHLVNLQTKYRGKLKIIGVLVESKHPAALKRFITGHDINYFVSSTPDNMKLAETTADMLHQPKNFSIPMMVLFVNGKYFRHYVGMVPEEMIESDIKEALKEVK